MKGMKGHEAGRVRRISRGGAEARKMKIRIAGGEPEDLAPSRQGAKKERPRVAAGGGMGGGWGGSQERASVRRPIPCPQRRQPGAGDAPRPHAVALGQLSSSTPASSAPLRENLWFRCGDQAGSVMS